MGFHSPRISFRLQLQKTLGIWGTNQIELICSVNTSKAIITLISHCTQNNPNCSPGPVHSDPCTCYYSFFLLYSTQSALACFLFLEYSIFVAPQGLCTWCLLCLKSSLASSLHGSLILVNQASAQPVPLRKAFPHHIS